MTEYKIVSFVAGGTETEYLTFGKGNKKLVIIPGLSPAPIKKTALFLVNHYKVFSDDYTVYIIDRRKNFPDNYTAEEISEDIYLMLTDLAPDGCDIIGISQGGMIAQYLVLYHPAIVNKLVLGITTCKNNEVLNKVISTWIDLVSKGEYAAFAEDMARKLYSHISETDIQKLIPVYEALFIPEDPQDFIRKAKSCLTCDTAQMLGTLENRTLVIGGDKDQIVSAKESYVLAEKTGSKLYMFEGYGHSVYLEKKFNEIIKEFLNDRL